MKHRKAIDHIFWLSFFIPFLIMWFVTFGLLALKTAKRMLVIGCWYILTPQIVASGGKTWNKTNFTACKGIHYRLCQKITLEVVWICIWGDLCLWKDVACNSIKVSTSAEAVTSVISLSIIFFPLSRFGLFDWRNDWLKSSPVTFVQTRQ